MTVCRCVFIAVISLLIIGCASTEKLDFQKSGLSISEQTSLITIGKRFQGVETYHMSLIEGIRSYQLLLPKGRHSLYLSCRGFTQTAGEVFLSLFSRERYGTSWSLSGIYNNFEVDGISEYETNCEIEGYEMFVWIINKRTREKDHTGKFNRTYFYKR